MSITRRGFLGALGGLIALAGLDPATVLEPLVAATDEALPALLGDWTITVGAYTFPLASMVAPRMTREPVEVTMPHDGEAGYIMGTRRFDPLRVTLSEQVPWSLITNVDAVPITVRLGKKLSMYFKAYVQGVENQTPATGVEVAQLSLVPSGPVVWEER